MASIHVLDFFVGKRQIQEVDMMQYQEINAYIDVLQAVSRLSYRSFYIIDYHKQNFLYISDNLQSLTGYSVEEIASWGYDFYLQTIMPDDLDRFLAINKAGFEFLHRLDRDEWTKYTISCNLCMRTASEGILQVNHQLTPLRFSPDGHLWLALCAVSLPSVKEKYDAYITCSNGLYHYALCNNLQHWKQLDRIKLKEVEKMIVRLANQGYTTEDMACEMYKSVDTIKKYRKALFEKLGVDNISGAITYAILYKLI